MRVNTKEKLPSWFNLSDYDYYMGMSDDDIVYQLSCRCNALITDEYKRDDFFIRKIKNGIYIYTGEGDRVSDENRMEIKKENRKCLSSSSTISLVNVMDIKESVASLRDNHGIDMSEKCNGFSDLFLHITALDDYPSFNADVLCKISLLKQDEIIISELKNLLKKWRVELGVPEKVPSIKNSWDVIKDKILSYRVFPLIDLMFWEGATSNKISNSVLAVTLFSNGEFGDLAISQTIRPFAKSLLEYETIDKIEHEIYKK
ncbi:DUF6387 family protein [Pectobacterium odoriferum]|uniref:DUF6387 family protein n=1 Tax=Pectobacterium TaxID=122277 RepID=UPI00196927C3|nr:DUF6387 family protein [Pectobacterium versatile]MBN3059760.1 hypothetical protein [Pectobacterium versatile]MCA5931391.1 DUF6387 family protein [Pectobacterium versatile]MCA5948670.1 DUF6387 family protein [Pectobacterium versatile]MCA5952941.1 DUF6387 family protein [Pectobacterium versatile]UCP87886.1 DUF6387 family protein [Pectobacterium versatile]